MAANLTSIAINTRRAVRYGIYFVIIFLIGRMLLNVGVGVYRAVFPPPPPPPTVLFNRLSSLPFPAREGLPNLSFKLETPSGGLPKFPTQRKVYYMPKASPTLTSLEDAKARAAKMGFVNAPVQVTSSIYRFASTDSAATLEMNIINGIFSISYNLANDPVPLEKQPPNEAVAVSSAKAFLTSGSSLAEDMDGPSSAEFLKVDSSGFSTALSLSEANLIKINLFRKDYDELPAKTADGKTANVWFILSGDTRTSRQTIAAEYHYFPIDEKQFSTYPTKTSQQAWTDLQSGRGFIASLGENTDGNVTIRRVYQAYYDPGQYYDYYQPIFVFEGDRNFVGYVPAVTDQYYGDVVSGL